MFIIFFIQIMQPALEEPALESLVTFCWYTPSHPVFMWSVYIQAILIKDILSVI